MVFNDEGRPEDEVFLSVHEAAELTGIHPQTLYKKIKTGDLPAWVRGRKKVVRLDELTQWAADQTAEPQRYVPTNRKATEQ